jgi:methyl coenzyme M reductase subunit D
MAAALDLQELFRFQKITSIHSVLSDGEKRSPQVVGSGKARKSPVNCTNRKFVSKEMQYQSKFQKKKDPPNW